MSSTSRIAASKSKDELVIVCEMSPCSDEHGHMGRLVLLRERRQVFFYASREQTDVVHLADVTYVKVALPRLHVVTNTRCVSFQSSSAAKLRTMAAAIKGELSCDQLLSWFARQAHIQFHDAPSAAAAVLLRSESRDRVVGAREKLELQVSIEALRPHHATPPAAAAARLPTLAAPLSAPPSAVHVVASELAPPARVVALPLPTDAADDNGAPLPPPPEPRDSPLLEPKRRASDGRVCDRCRAAKAKMRVEVQSADGSPAQKMVLCRPCVAQLASEKQR